MRTEGSGHKKRLIASFEDDSGEIEVLGFNERKRFNNDPDWKALFAVWQVAGL
jgi:hypothetical protein